MTSASKIGAGFDVGAEGCIGGRHAHAAILRDGTPKIAFDSVGLTIQSVTVNKAPAEIEATASKARRSPPSPRHTTATVRWEIRYEGKTREGTLFHPAQQELSRPPQADMDARANPKTPATTARL